MQRQAITGLAPRRQLATVLVVVMAAIGDHTVNCDIVAERQGQPTRGAAPPTIRIAMATSEKADGPRDLP